MGGLLGGGGGIAQQAPETNLQVQTSANGNALPIVYGTVRMAGNLIWYGGFYYTASASGGSGKGGVGGGAGKGGGSSGYNYFASWQFGLCEGQIVGFGSVWANGAKQTAAFYGLTTSLGGYSQTPWTYLTTNYGYVNEAHTIPSSGPYVVAVTYPTQFMIDNGVTGPTSLAQAATAAPGLYSIQTIGKNFVLTFDASYAGLSVTLKNANFTGTYTIPSVAPYTVTWVYSYAPQTVTLVSSTYALVAGVPASGQYSTDGAGNYTFNAAQAGNKVTISYASNTQTPGFAALGYSGIAWAGAPNYSLGQSPSLPNFNYEIQGIYSTSVGSLPDADPSLVAFDLLTNAKYGAGFPSSKLGSFTNYQNYTLAAGLLVSFKLDSQTPANTILADLATVTNSAWAWVNGALTLVPYGDVSLTANGKTYTPPAAPLYDLTDNDFIRIKGQDPVQLNRKRPVDAANWIQMSFSNRNIQYNSDTVEYKNEVVINKFKTRPMPVSSISTDFFCDPSIAQQSVNLQGQRQLVLNTYTFALDQRYIVLDCMDIVSLTDSVLGLNKQWVRITGITENSDYTLTFTAEEYLGGTGASATNSFQSNNGYSTNFNTSPGNINTPIVFAAPVQTATNSGLEVWMIVSGSNSNYGGCQVWASSDDENYKLVQPQISGNARQGVVVSDGAGGMTVDLTESTGQLLSGNPIDAQLGNTLCIAINPSTGSFELFSYQTALLTSTAYNYSLTGLQRALYGTSTPGGYWPANTLFGRLDSQTFIEPYNQNQIGQPLYLKFLAFNVYGGGLQTLDNVSPYIYNVQGPPIPPDVTNFGVTQQGVSVVFTWNKVVDAGLKGYDIRYAPQGTSSWALMQPLTEATAGTEMTNAGVPPGTWVFAIRARDVANQLSTNMATQNLVVTNPNTTIQTSVQEPNWLGTLSGWGLHYSGVLYPNGTKAPSTYTTLSPPAAPTLTQTSGGLLAATTYFVKITYAGSGTETTPSAESSLLVLLDNLLEVISPPSSGNAVGYNVYVSTTTGTETLQNTTPVPFGTNWILPTSGLVTGTAQPTANTTGWEVFNSYCPDPVTSAVYTAPTIDTGYDANLRVYFTQMLTPGMSVTGTPVYAESIDTWLTGGADSGVYTPWTIGTLTMRYINARITHTPSTVPSYMSDFTVILDTAPQIEQASSVVIAPGGTTITFPTPYHSAPEVFVSTGGGTALYASWSNITKTQFQVNVFNSSGSDVGGTVSWSSTGS